MPGIARILLSALIGTIVCAGLSFLMFFLLTVFDKQSLVEAFAFGVIVGIVGAFVGMVIGAAVGIGDFGVLGGGVVGFLVTLIVAAIYVFFAASSSGRYAHFVSESRIIFIVLSVPTILTGIITALLKRLIIKPQGKLFSPRQS